MIGRVRGVLNSLDHNFVDVGALADLLISDGVHTKLDRTGLRQRTKSNMA